MNTTFFLLFLALIVMIGNLVRGLQLRRKVHRGIVGLRLGQLLLMIPLFTVGYLAAAISALGQPESSASLILAVILLLGAAFVALVLRLIRDVIATLS